MLSRTLNISFLKYTQYKTMHRIIIIIQNKIYTSLVITVSLMKEFVSINDNINALISLVLMILRVIMILKVIV